MKTCKKCGQTKSASEFYATNKDRKYTRGSCKECFRQQIKREHPYDRDGRLRRLYGVSIPKLGACDLCGDTAELVVDHSHKTGAVRGQLCQLCNRGLGHFRDDASLLQKAIKYLGGR